MFCVQPLSEEHAIVWALWNVNLVGWILILITKPVRRSVSFVQTMYASSDRPEDKGELIFYFVWAIRLTDVMFCLQGCRKYTLGSRSRSPS